MAFAWQHVQKNVSGDKNWNYHGQGKNSVDSKKSLKLQKQKRERMLNAVVPWDIKATIEFMQRATAMISKV